MGTKFGKFSAKVSSAVGSYQAFIIALSFIVIWFLVSSIFFHLDERSQMWVNTCTTIVTFLMVFMIQSSQNRDTVSIHDKLDELLRAVPDADDEALAGIEKRF